MNLSLLFESASGWVLMFLGLGFLVFVHELGHFLMAVRAVVNVEVFSVGIGPFLLTTTHRGTVYALSMVPFGGYVRMTGQTDLVVERKGPTRPDSYMAKGPGARAFILAAGAVMNLLVAYFLFVLAIGAGARFVPAEIGRFREKDARYTELVRAGIAPGDRILEVDGARVDRFDWDMRQLVAARAGDEVRLKLRRAAGGEVYETTMRTVRDEDIGLVALNIPRPTETIRFHLGVEGMRCILFRPAPQIAEETLTDFELLTDLAVPDAPRGAEGAPPPSAPGLGVTRDALQAALESAGRTGRPLRLTLFDGSRARAVTARAKPVHLVGIVLKDLAVQAVVPGSPAEGAGLRPGDRVLSFGGEAVESDRDLIRRIRGSEGREFEIEIESKADGSGCAAPAVSKRTVRLAAQHEGWELSIPGEPLQPLGEVVLVRRFVPGSTGREAGLRENDLILGLIRRGKGRSARITWWRRGESRRETRVHLMDDGPALAFEVEKRVPLRANAFARGARDLVFSIRMVASVLGGLFRGRVSSRAISGPLGIGVITKVSTEFGFGNFLWILAMISANLGVINLLPVPILDGGHLVFLAYEKLRGKPASTRVQEFALYLGLALILMLVAVAMRNDIASLFFNR